MQRPSSRVRRISALGSSLVQRSLRSHPSLASTEHCPCHGPWLVEPLLLISGHGKQQACTSRFGWSRDNQKGAASRAAKTRTVNERGHGRSRRPPPWTTDVPSVAATIAYRYGISRHTCLSLLFLSTPRISSLSLLCSQGCLYFAQQCKFRRGA